MAEEPNYAYASGDTDTLLSMHEGEEVLMNSSATNTTSYASADPDNEDDGYLDTEPGDSISPSGYWGHGLAIRQQQRKFGIRPTPWSQAALCVAMAMVSGTYYNYGLYATQIRYTSRFTELEVQILGALLAFGNFSLAPVMGALHDRMGSQGAMPFGFFFAGLGYFLFSISIESGVNSESWMALALGFAGAGNILIFIAAMNTMRSNFRKGVRANAILAITLSFGFGSFIMASLYAVVDFGKNHLDDWINVLSVLIWVITGSAWAVLTPMLAQEDDEDQNQTSNQAAPCGLVAATYNPLCSVQHEDDVDDGDGLVSGGLSIADDDVSRERRAEDWSAVFSELISQRAFWLIAIPSGICQGIALWTSASVSSMAMSLDQVNFSEISYQVLLVFVCGWLVSAAVVNAFLARRARNVSFYVTVLCGISAVAQILFAAASSTGMLYAMNTLMGCVSGGLMMVVVSTASDLWTEDAFGKTVGLFLCIPGFVQIIFNLGAAAGYDSNTNSILFSHIKTKICVEGLNDDRCFSTANYAAFGLSVVAAAISFIGTQRETNAV